MNAVVNCLKANDWAGLAAIVATRFGLIVDAEDLRRECEKHYVIAVRLNGNPNCWPWSESSWLCWLRNRLDRIEIRGEVVPERRPARERANNGSFLIGVSEKRLTEAFRINMGFGLLAKAGDMNTSQYEFPTHAELKRESERGD